MMKGGHLVTLLLALSWCHASFAQIEADTIPFQTNRSGNILIPVVVNEQDSLILMLHTGTSGMSVVKDSSARYPSIEWQGSDSTATWGGSDESEWGADNHVRMGTHLSSDVLIWSGKNSGPGSDGKIGLDLLGGQMVEINHDLSSLIVYRESHAPEGSLKALRLRRDGAFFFVKARLRAGGFKKNHEFLLHTGYGGSLLLNEDFVAASGIDEHILVDSTQTLQDSHGNPVHVVSGRLHGLELGDLTLEDVPVGFFKGRIGSHGMSVMGCGIWSRFNWLLDTKNQRLYLWKRESS